MRRALESYLLRRAVCGYTTKNYTRIFLTLTRNLRRGAITAEAFVRHLADQVGESSEWPSDGTFREAWRTRHAYQTLNNPKVVYIFKRLNGTYIGSKSEAVTVDGPLSVEHILPQSWVEHWPLPNGQQGMTVHETWEADESDPRTVMSRQRHAVLQTFGNLTILAQGLNSAVSNSAWSEKKPELLRHSLLPINQMLVDVDTWDEKVIVARGDALFERALEVWPRA